MTVLAAILPIIWMIGIWWMTRSRRYDWRLMLFGAFAACVTVVLAWPPLWASALGGYAGDSFWTLGVGGRIGVVAISMGGFAIIFLVLAAKTRALLRLQPPVPSTVLALIDAGVGLMVYAVLYSVSPQIFYSFYRLIFAGLPNQIVVETVLDLERLQRIAAIAHGGLMSDHLAGIGLWAVVPFTLWLHLRRSGIGLPTRSGTT